MAVDADEILTFLGGWGLHQTLLFLSLSFVYLRGAWQVFAIVFIGADPGYQCRIPVNNIENTSAVYYLEGKCNVLKELESVNHSLSCPNGYTYGEEFESTILSEFDLVCDRDYMVALATTVYMIGNALGAVLITPLADRFGRKWVLLICLWVQGAIVLGVAFVQHYVTFVLLRFLVGFLNMPIALIAYVMIAEIFPAASRTRPSVGVNLFWSLGIIILSVIAFFVRDWRYLEIIIAIPNFITLLYISFLPESIPWLISQKKWKWLKDVVKLAAKRNELTLSEQMMCDLEDKSNKQEIDIEVLESDYQIVKSGPVNTEDIALETGQSQEALTLSSPFEKGVRRYTMLDLFKTSKMRRYTFIMFLLWFVSSLGYFGILFSTPALHGNIFVNLALSGAVEIPACLLCLFVIERTGRRKPLVFFMLLCGIMNIVAVFIPQETASGANLVPLIICLAMVGKFGITGAYSTVYLMSAEIYPTAVRNQAVGLSSFFENAGNIAAPFIVYGAKSFNQLPLVLFGVLTVIGGILAVYLPETQDQALPETIDYEEEPAKQRDNRSVKYQFV